MAHSARHATMQQGGAARMLLLGAVLLTGITIVSVGTARMTGIGRQHVPVATPVQSLAVRFADGQDGSIAITDAGDGQLIHRVPPASDGFIRGTMRGLVRERKRIDVDAGPPFRLTRWTDGTLTLEDDATGRRIELDAFGPTNAASFAMLFNGGSSSR